MVFEKEQQILSQQQSELSKAREQLGLEQQKVSSYESYIGSLRLPQRTITTQLSQPEILPVYKKEQIKLRQFKTGEGEKISKAKQELSSFEQSQLIPAEQKLKAQQEEIAEWEQASQLVGTPYSAFAPKQIRTKVLELERGSKAYVEKTLSAEIESSYKGTEFKPIIDFSKLGTTGKINITGFEDTTKKVLIPTSEFTKYLQTSATPETIAKLEKAGVITTTTTQPLVSEIEFKYDFYDKLKFESKALKDTWAGEKISGGINLFKTLTESKALKSLKDMPLKETSLGKTFIGGKISSSVDWAESKNIISGGLYKSSEDVFFNYLLPVKPTKNILGSFSSIATQQRTFDILPYGLGNRKINLYSSFGEQKIIKQGFDETLSFIPESYAGLGLTTAGIWGGNIFYKAFPKIASVTFATIGGVEGKSKIESGNIGGGIVDITLGAIPLASETTKGFYDIYSTRGGLKINLREETTGSFFKPSINKEVYMKRFEGFKIGDIKTYLPTITGRKKGTFLERQYELIDLGTLKKFNQGIVGGYPRAPTFTHEKFAREISLVKYGLPKTSELMVDVKGMGFGYSATAYKWQTQQIGEAGQFYSFKGISVPFLRLNKGKYYDASWTFESPFKLTKPVVYAGYFPQENIIVSPTSKEIRIANPYGGRKKIKKYIFDIPTEAGKIYLPLDKTEVQGVAFGTQAPIRESSWFKLGGRRIKVVELILESSLSPKQLSVSKSLKSYQPSGKYYSSLPTKTSLNIYTGSSLTKNILSPLTKPKTKISSTADYKQSYIYIPKSYSYLSKTSTTYKTTPVEITKLLTPKFSYYPPEKKTDKIIIPYPPTYKTKPYTFEKTFIIPPKYQDTKQKQYKRIINLQISQPTKYTPSFTAVSLGIRGKQPKPLSKSLGYNVIKIRPIINNKFKF